MGNPNEGEQTSYSRASQIDFPIIILTQVQECVNAFNYVTTVANEDPATAKRLLVDKVTTLHITLTPYWDKDYKAALTKLNKKKRNEKMTEFEWFRYRQMKKYSEIMKLLDRCNLLLEGTAEDEW